ncbi:MAG: hypothetical protein SGJ21_00020 [Alphaproteobacteria bacterium]|nr:hypothetical protein [Alphaproteobacteria bacterium]
MKIGLWLRERSWLKWLNTEECTETTRAFAAGRLRAQTPDAAARERIMPVFTGADSLFRMFDSGQDTAVATIRLD